MTSPLRMGMVLVFWIACSAFAQETPPPPVEPEIDPASRLVEPRAEELVRKMADLLSGANAFTLEAEEVFDEVPEQSPRTQLANRRRMLLRRPDRFAADAWGDAFDRSVWYDGKTFSMLNREQNVYVTEPVPETVDAVLDHVFDRTGTVIPLTDFLYRDVYERLMGSVERGVYLGIHEAAGVPCHHLSFEQESVDWQLWIDAGDEPLPRKLSIAYKTEEGIPQYSATISKWNLKPDLPEERFRFVPPAGAERVEMPRETQAEERP